MARKMRIVLSVTVGLGLLLVCFVTYAYYDIKHNFLAFSPQQVSECRLR